MMKILCHFICTLILVGSFITFGVDVEADDVVEFFKRVDSNQDGVLSKKEFYYALMEDGFEELSSKYSVPSLEIEFEDQDENRDKRISLQEWKSIFIPRRSKSDSSKTDKNDIGSSDQVLKRLMILAYFFKVVNDI